MHEKNSELFTVLQGLGLYFLGKLPLSAISTKKPKVAQINKNNFEVVMLSTFI